jgi:hypothetical protein
MQKLKCVNHISKLQTSNARQGNIIINLKRQAFPVPKMNSSLWKAHELWFARGPGVSPAQEGRLQDSLSEVIREIFNNYIEDEM